MSGEDNPVNSSGSPVVRIWIANKPKLSAFHSRTPRSLHGLLHVPDGSITYSARNLRIDVDGGQAYGVVRPVVFVLLSIGPLNQRGDTLPDPPILLCLYKASARAKESLVVPW